MGNSVKKLTRKIIMRAMINSIDTDLLAERR